MYFRFFQKRQRIKNQQPDVPYFIIKIPSSMSQQPNFMVKMGKEVLKLANCFAIMALKKSLGLSDPQFSYNKIKELN